MFTLNYSYRIYPSLEQEARMIAWLETCRGVYNYALRERKDWIKSRSCPVNACSLESESIIPADAPYPNYYAQKRNLTQAKKDFPHLQDVQSQVLQDVIGRVEAAFTARGWYATLCIQADVDVPEVPPSGASIGVDVGLEYFLSASDGLQVERPRFFNKLHRQLKLLQRRLKNKQKGSNNRTKLIRRIGRVHEQIAACRLDWQCKLAHRLCNVAQMIFVEDLDFRIMARGMLGKHTLDAGLGQFVNQVLPWVCFKRGVYYGKVDPNGTSQECPDCGARVPKSLSERMHRCHECGSVKPRDIASAQVINARGLSGKQNCLWSRGSGDMGNHI